MNDITNINETQLELVEQDPKRDKLEEVNQLYQKLSIKLDLILEKIKLRKGN